MIIGMVFYQNARGGQGRESANATLLLQGQTHPATITLGKPA
jgi:hypothetical protein